jgi:hypothetical protein
VNQVFVEVVSQLSRQLHEKRTPGGDQTTILPSLTVASAVLAQTASSTSSAASSTMSSSQQGGSSGPTSSPLLFFVALGFGVVFTNLW